MRLTTTSSAPDTPPSAKRRVGVVVGTSLAAGAVLVAVCAGALLGVLPAQAAGNASLDHLILSDPEPGWTSLSSSELNTFQTDVQNELSSKSSTQTFATAVEGWQSPSGFSTASLVIFLVQALSGSVGGPASAEASGFCSGATDQTPTSPQPIAGMSDGSTTTCSGEGESVTVGAGITGNYLALVASFGSSPLSASTIGPIVSNQVTAVSNAEGSGSTAPSGSTSSSSSIPIIAGAGGGAVVVIAVVVFFLLRRRQHQPTDAATGQGSVPAYMPGAPVPGAPIPGSPIPGSPIQGSPVPGAPIPGAPVQTFGGFETSPPPASAPSYSSVPSAPQSHDPWGDSDPGWLSSHEAAEARAAQAGAVQGGSLEGDGAHSGTTTQGETTPGATTQGGATQGGAQTGPPEARAPGWFQEGDDPSTMRYWDGTTFTSRRKWNGSAWVDA
jgi:hypothetical protein